MACFLVSAGEAVVTTAIKKGVEAKEKELANKTTSTICAEESTKIPFSRKLKWLTNMLWGGSALLAFEHVWHGEVVPWPPFLTAASNPADTAEMLHEMSTIGVTMAVIITAVWGGMLVVAHSVEKKALNALNAQEA